MSQEQVTKLEITIDYPVDGWVRAMVEDQNGVLLGIETAPVVEGATFDVRSAVVRAAVEQALAYVPEAVPNA